VEYVELEMMKVVLISYKREKVINIILKSEMTQLFLDTFFFFANDSVIMGRREYI